MRLSSSTVTLLGAGFAVMLTVCAAAPASAQDWSGCFIGAQVGYGSGAAEVTDLPFEQGPFAGTGVSWNSVAPPYDRIDLSDQGATGAIELGCDYQVMSSAAAAFVAGVTADIGVIDLSDSRSSLAFPDTNASFNVDWLGSVRGRLGVGLPSTLFYMTGGLGLAGVHTRAFDLDASNIGVMDVSRQGTNAGWVVGAGIEHRLSQSWSVTLEYLHYQFGRTVATGEAIAPAGAFPRFGTDLKLDTVRVGVRWRR